MSDLAKKAGIARITYPTAVINGEHVHASFDKIGRQLIQPFCMREMIATSVCTIALNDSTHAGDPDNETTLIAGDAANFLDAYYIYGSNASNNAVRIVLRTGHLGTDIMEIDIAANGVSIIQPPLPYPQSERDQSWYVDWGVNANIADVNDVTNTAVVVGGFFIRNG
uniref:Uncharacterized protein n=1 Tax=viral metagenome TaxID=1070528 RepID=A0A6M3L7T7_9ZZZZ